MNINSTGQNAVPDYWNLLGVLIRAFGLVLCGKNLAGVIFQAGVCRSRVQQLADCCVPQWNGESLINSKYV